MGDPNDAHNAGSGVAYVFVRSGFSWSQEQKLIPDDGAEEDFFGHAVSVSGSTVLVGAHRDDDDSTDSGSAYIFDLSLP